MTSSTTERKRYEREDPDPVSRLGLKVVYEDPEVLVITAPNEDELREIILELLKERPMNVKELHSILSGLASEDKIRKALIRLADAGRVMPLPDGRFAVMGID